MTANQHDIRLAERLRNRLAERRGLDQEIGRTGDVACVEYRRTLAEKRRVLQDRLQRILGHGKGHDGRRVTEDDGIDVRPQLIDLAVNETLFVRATAFRIYRSWHDRLISS